MDHEPLEIIAGTDWLLGVSEYMGHVLDTSQAKVSLPQKKMLFILSQVGTLKSCMPNLIQDIFNVIFCFLCFFASGQADLVYTNDQVFCGLLAQKLGFVVERSPFFMYFGRF